MWVLPIFMDGWLTPSHFVILDGLASGGGMYSPRPVGASYFGQQAYWVPKRWASPAGTLMESLAEGMGGGGSHAVAIMMNACSHSRALFMHSLSRVFHPLHFVCMCECLWVWKREKEGWEGVVCVDVCVSPPQFVAGYCPLLTCNCFRVWTFLLVLS